MAWSTLSPHALLLFFIQLSNDSVVTLQSTMSPGLMLLAFCLVLRNVVSMKSATASSVAYRCREKDLTICATDKRASLSFNSKTA